MMPKAARERGHKPRPQEPHSLHQSAVTGDALTERGLIRWFVTETVTVVKCWCNFSDLPYCSKPKRRCCRSDEYRSSLSFTIDCGAAFTMPDFVRTPIGIGGST